MPEIKIGTEVDIEYPSPSGPTIGAKAKVIAVTHGIMTLEWKDPAGNVHRAPFPVAAAYDKKPKKP